MDIHFFNEELEEFIRDLRKPEIAKVLRTIDLLEKFGNRLGMPHSKPLKDGIFELRMRGVQEIRILYTFQKQSAVLLVGFVKKTQKTPARYLALALMNKKQLDEI